MTNLGNLMGENWARIKKIGAVNTEIEQYGGPAFTTVGAGVLAIKLSEKFSSQFETFCKKKNITPAEALEQIQSDTDFVAKIVPFLIRDIPLTEKSEGAYRILITELGISDELKEEALQALKIAGSIKLDRLFS